MYEIEVKKHLVHRLFPRAGGWTVTVHLDGSELGTAGCQSREKQVIAAALRNELIQEGVTVGVHPYFGAVDLVAEKQGTTPVIVEVKGDTNGQPEVQLYSALGQLILSMDAPPSERRYAIAMPDSPIWEAQFEKIPRRVPLALGFEMWLVGDGGARLFGT